MPLKPENYQWFQPGGEETFLLAELQKVVGVPKRSLRVCAVEGKRNPRNGTLIFMRVCRLPLGIGSTVEEYERFIERLNEE